MVEKNPCTDMFIPVDLLDSLARDCEKKRKLIGLAIYVLCLVAQSASATGAHAAA